jgi:hypothetical protein
LLHVQELFIGISEAYVPFEGDPLDEIEHYTQSVFLFEFLQGDEKIYYRRKLFRI